MGWSEFRNTGLTHVDDRSSEGYTCLTPVGGDHIYLLDHKGRICHGWSHPGFVPGYGFMLPGGRLLVRGQPHQEKVAAGMSAGGADIILELDWEGKVLWRYEHPSFHHDMFRLENGNTLLITWQVAGEEIKNQIKGWIDENENSYRWSSEEHINFMMAGLGVGGRPRDMSGYLSDQIVELTPEGEVVKFWNAWEHMDPEADPTCSREFRHEWTHCNSVDYKDGKVLLSFRECSRLVILDWDTGELEWKWGGYELSHQHDASFTEKGTVLVFDNGVHHPVVPHTRVLEIDPTTDKIIWQYMPKVVFSLHSGHIGGCQRLENGNTLIIEGQSGRVFEVTPENETCWEWISPFVLPFKNVHCSMIFKARRYGAESPELAGVKFESEKWRELNSRMGLA